ncbi:MAG TPA: Ig-like domain-containing protein [Gemmatimonadaceae bacterium]|nr:Ig-like domain-containing protein [Gemmatimonadaceae bacterium]
MHPSLRSIAPVIIAAGLAACSDTPHAPVRRAGAGAHIAIAPVFSRAASAAAADLAIFGIRYDHVRITITRPPTESVKDTTLSFSPESNDISLDLTVDVHEPGESFDAVIDYTSNGRVVFHGTGRVQAHDGDHSAAPTELPIEYVGPGASATRLVITPRTASVLRNETKTFTAAAFDANNAPVPDALVAWTSSDPSIATISSDGVLHPTGSRGTVTITASTPSGASDNATATIVLPPASISLVSGAGQIGKVGALLPSPAVVRVSSVDGAGVPGVTVVFAAPAGGSVSSATATTDANGRASTTLKLGTLIGAQSFLATTGEFSVAIPATATAGDPASITALSGSGQSDTVRATVAPLVARVTDQFGNPTPGVVVTWKTSSLVAILGASTSTTDADGRATMKYTLGSIPGVETVSASVSGVAAPALFTLQTLAGPPTRLSIVSGDKLTGSVGSSSTTLLVVKVTDAVGTPIMGASVVWTASNGTVGAKTTTDVSGLSSNTLTLGTHTGDVVVTAALANGASAVSFHASALAGAPTALKFASQPVYKLATLLAPVSVMIVDRYGNQTTSTDPVTISVANGLSSFLGGTLTRNAANGAATFDDLTFSLLTGDQVLFATSGSLAQAVSQPIPSQTATGLKLGLLDAAKLSIGTASDTVSLAAGLVASSPLLYARVLDQAGAPAVGLEVDFDISGGPGSTSRISQETDVQGLAAFAGPIAVAGVYRIDVSCAHSACTSSSQAAAVVH